MDQGGAGGKAEGVQAEGGKLKGFRPKGFRLKDNMVDLVHLIDFVQPNKQKNQTN